MLSFGEHQFFINALDQKNFHELLNYYLKKLTLIFYFLQVTQSTYVCSAHFQSGDFKWTPNRKCLKPFSVPSVFSWTNDENEPRKPPKKRLFHPDR